MTDEPEQLPSRLTEYLQIRRYTADAIRARALEAAFDLDFFDQPADRDRQSTASRSEPEECDSRGRALLTALLRQHGVLSISDDGTELTDDFRRALKFRDLMRTLLKFASLLAADYFRALPALLRSADEFMAEARLFELFDYASCAAVSEDSCRKAAEWMQLTTMLTRYEAPVLSHLTDLSGCSSLLDLGGNSGELAAQLCRSHPRLQATVVDLPAVCEVGRRQLESSAEAERVRFSSLNFAEDRLPGGQDVVSFKSVLHDWRDDQVPGVIANAWEAVRAGGRLVIFERSRTDPENTEFTYGDLPTMLFFRSYRRPDLYVRILNSLGAEQLQLRRIRLDTDFMLLTARKPVSAGSG